MSEYEAKGTHAHLDLSEISHRHYLNDGKLLLSLLVQAVESVGGHVLAQKVHAFDPQGISAMVILAESHASIHTYPEHGWAFADIFTCGDLDPAKGLELIARELGGKSYISVIKRGMWEEAGSMQKMESRFSHEGV